VPIVLRTERLTLRRFTEDDVERLFELNSDPEVMRYLTGGKPMPREVIRDEIIPFHLTVYQRFNGLGTWAAETSTGGEFLGWFHLRAGPGADITNVDLGYRLRRPAWNKGYATEGSLALIRTGFTDLGADRVFAHTMSGNAASRRVLEKCGLVFAGAFGSGGPGDAAGAAEAAEDGEVEYALTRAQWAARN
jgi:RimJ/RimL family protein N-acetyltransferase